VQASAEPNVSSDSKANDSLTNSDSAVHQELDISKKIWDNAYDSVEIDDDKLVQAYILALRIFLEGGKSKEVSLSEVIRVSAELNDRTKRQGLMGSLVTHGQKKAKKDSKSRKLLVMLQNGH
jgi:hypothetical protein